MTAKSNHLLEAALAYAALGFPVIPIHGLRVVGRDAKKNEVTGCTCAKGSTCGRSAGKHPRITDWQNCATSNLETIRGWWWRNPDSNIGWAMGGTARLVAIDVDGDIGRVSLEALQAKNEKLPRTLTARSGREDGGEHLIFTVPPEWDLELVKNNAGKLAPGLDVRSQGGQIVVAPSMHASGRPYEWADAGSISLLPRWLFEACVARKVSEKSTTKAQVTFDDSVSVQDLRKYLVARRRKLANGDSDDLKKCELFTRIIEHKAIAEPRSRAMTINQALTLIAWIVPVNTPVDAWIEMATDSYNRAAWRRANYNAEVKAWNEDFLAQIKAKRAASGRPAGTLG